MIALVVATALAMAPAVGTAPAAPAACPEVGWVGFTPTAPYDPAVAAIAAPLWWTSLVFPCPSLAWGVGTASLQGPLPLDGSAGSVALAHSVGLACCGLPLAATGIGLPLVLLESMWVAPVSVLNAMDRDVKCARARRAPSTSSPAPPPPPASSPPASPPSAPKPSRGDPLPLPPEPGASSTSSLSASPSMAF
jgi:hypothetical protein